MADQMTIAQALDYCRRASSLAPQSPIDLYHRGKGDRFTADASELVDLLRLSLGHLQAKAAQLRDDGNTQEAAAGCDQIQRTVQLIAWLEAK